MTQRVRFLAAALRERLGWSPWLTGFGLLGVGLAAFCAVAALIRGVEIAPEGNLFETATFDAALGIFILTMVVLASGVTWTSRGRNVWLAALIAFLTYAYTIETVQAFRGLDPRFSQVAGPLDQAAGGIFFLDAVAIMICFIVLAVKYFRAAGTPVNIAVRYGALASLLAFGVGIWMSGVTQGRHVPEEGNLLFLHAAGFHGLQAVPLPALFLRWADTAEPLAHRHVHLAGLFWLGMCLAIAWQSGSGRSLFALTPATGGAALLLIGWLLVALMAARVWLAAPAFRTR